MAPTVDEAVNTPLDGWQYLDHNRNPQGPFPVTYLQELNKAGYFNLDALFWREGQGEWKPLKDLPGLQALLQRAQPATEAPAPAALAAAQPAADPNSRRGPGAAVASAPARRGGPPAPQDRALAGFLDEISALEAAETPTSPSPEERAFVDDDGTRYEWDPAQRKFAPAGDDGLNEGGQAAAAAAAYNEQDMVFEPEAEAVPRYEPPPDADAAGSDEDADALAATAGSEEAPAGDADRAGGGRKLGGKRDANEAALEAAQEEAKRAKAARDAQEGWFEQKKNTSVYITGLPDDVTEAEVAETFGKCGIIKEDPELRRPRIKIYRDQATNTPKGDGLVTYLKEPSVALAVQLLDGTPFRFGMPHAMTVSPAKFEQKGGQFVKKAGPAKRQKKRVVEAQEKKALAWTGFDDVAKPQEVTVVLRHMFHPDDFAADLMFREELKRDVLEEAGRLGRVEKLRIFSGNPEGVLTVKFATAEAADACVARMHGRWFAGRQVEASKWDGFTNYNVRPQGESEEEQAARLEAFARELEAVEAAKAAADAAEAAAGEAPGSD